jgi:hypothetical protein
MMANFTWSLLFIAAGTGHRRGLAATSPQRARSPMAAGEA